MNKHTNSPSKMAVTLGKRKRTASEKREKLPKRLPKQATESDDNDDDAEARALLKKAFEAKFEPLHVQPIPSKPQTEVAEENDEDDSDAESDWSGLSGDEDEVEVIEHVIPTIDSIFDASAKKFLSSKPPTSDTENDNSKSQAKAKKAASTTDEDGTESTNLKHDLALQRLLKESHLLDASSFSSSSFSPTAPEGKNRLKALDMRILDLGAKNSTLQQENMPMHIRKGIAGKAANRETTRRREAKENGVILEKFKSSAPSKVRKQRRERGVGGVGIGKMQGSTLKLSSYDIRSIEGTRTRSSGSGKRGGKRR